MAYLISLVILALIFLALHYFTELAKMHKITITSILFIVIYSAIAYNTYNNEQGKKLLNNITKFEQGKTLKCSNRDINQTNYSLSIGTYTFIGKEETPYYGEMISASTCQ